MNEAKVPVSMPTVRSLVTDRGELKRWVQDAASPGVFMGFGNFSIALSGIRISLLSRLVSCCVVCLFLSCSPYFDFSVSCLGISEVVYTSSFFHCPFHPSVQSNILYLSSVSPIHIRLVASGSSSIIRYDLHISTSAQVSGVNFLSIKTFRLLVRAMKLYQRTWNVLLLMGLGMPMCDAGPLRRDGDAGRKSYVNTHTLFPLIFCAVITMIPAYDSELNDRY